MSAFGKEDMFPDCNDIREYRVCIPADEWDDWKDHVPRSTPLYERLYHLVELDLAFEGDADLAELRLMEMKFERVRERCKTGLNALANGNEEKAREEFLEIRDVASVE